MRDYGRLSLCVTAKGNFLKTISQHTHYDGFNISALHRFSTINILCRYLSIPHHIPEFTGSLQINILAGTAERIVIQCLVVAGASLTKRQLVCGTQSYLDYEGPPWYQGRENETDKEHLVHGLTYITD